VERGHELKAPHITAAARLALAKFHLLHSVQPSDDPATTPASSTPSLDGGGVPHAGGHVAGMGGQEDGVEGLAGRAGMFGEGLGRLSAAAAAVHKGKAGEAAGAPGPGEGLRVIPPVHMAATARDVALLHHAAALEAVSPGALQGTSASQLAQQGQMLAGGPHRGR